MIRGRLVPRAELSSRQVDEMFELLGAHFDGVSRPVFERDLAGKNWVILLEDGRIRGFSTLLHYQSSDVSVVYSGDTIVERAHWGSPALARTWIQSVHRLRVPRRCLYWLLLSSGYRTYRFLPIFLKSFYPRHDLPATPDLLDRLAVERFGRAYRHGIVRFDQPHRLRGELLEVPEGRLGDPHVAYFLRRNPGYIHGDELVCLAEIAPENLTEAGRRMWGGDRWA